MSHDPPPNPQTQPPQNNRRAGRAPHHRGPRHPDGEGMSTSLKVVLIFAGIFALCGLFCCGVGYHLYSQFDFSYDDDPEAAVAITESIADIDIPDSFEPHGWLNMNWVFMTMRVASYEHHTSEHGSLMIAEAEITFGDPAETEEILQESLEEQGNEEQELRILSMERRDFEIRGQPVTFQFSEAEHRTTGVPYRRVSGAFPARQDGLAMIYLEIEQANYDEPAIVAMIESIR